MSCFLPGISMCLPRNMASAVGRNSDVFLRRSHANGGLHFASPPLCACYDCFYLALAEREGAPLVSADRTLMAAETRVKGIEVRTF